MSEAHTPSPLLVPLGRLLEVALNRVLALDEAALQRLQSLEGRAMAIELQGLGLALRIGVEQGRLTVGPKSGPAADLNLAATPGSLLALLLRRNDERSAIPAGKVAFSGDAELLRTVERLIAKFDPDWEEPFAQAFGDILGVQIARGLKRAFEWSRHSAQTLLQDGADYLREESRDTLAPAEMHAFLDDVDALRDRVERLAARLARLGIAMDRA